MRTCKVRPDHNVCMGCLDEEIEFGVFNDCKKCSLNTAEYELLQFGTGIWSGDYAIVQKDGKIEKVPLRRVYDVKEV